MVRGQQAGGDERQATRERGEVCAQPTELSVELSHELRSLLVVDAELLLQSGVSFCQLRTELVGHSGQARDVELGSQAERDQEEQGQADSQGSGRAALGASEGILAVLAVLAVDAVLTGLAAAVDVDACGVVPVTVMS